MHSLSPGLTLVIFGCVIVAIGLLVWSGALSWFGRLPGDIRIEGGTTRIYVPIVSMLIVSLVVSLVLLVIRRLR
jgi:NAD/NADP transhydrogenase beta subunit